MKHIRGTKPAPRASVVLRGEPRRVLIKLGPNAVHAMPEGGRLTVASAAIPREWAVRMRDRGVGIGETTGRRIFEPFFPTKEAGLGTGLGLSVSYGILRKRGGRIDFRSSLGKETTLHVENPILDSPPEARK